MKWTSIRSILGRSVLVLLPAYLFVQCGCDNAPESTAGFTQRSDTLVLENAVLVDVRAGELREEVDILIEGGQVAGVFEHGQGRDDQSMQRLDLGGRYVVPGLIEGHTHISPLPEVSLTIALGKGIVAIRDMAGDGAYIALVKQAIADGELVAPDVYFSAAMGGEELIWNDSRIRLATPPDYELGEAPWARLVTDESDIPQVIADAKACGATGVKLYAHLTADLVRQLSDEAKRHGLKVWAHMVPYPASAEEVASAGVEVVSHAAFFTLPPDWEFKDGSRAMDPANVDEARLAALLDIMKANEVVLDPTLVVTDAMLAGVSDRDRVAALKRAIYAATRAAHDRGIPMIAGTDEPLPRDTGTRQPLHRELELLVTEVGLSPMEALQTATINAARVLGAEDVLGTVEAGKPASLVVLNANPLDDIQALEDIEFVMKDGWIVR